MKPIEALTRLAIIASNNEARVMTRLTVKRDEEFISLYGKEPFGLVAIEIPASINEMLINNPPAGSVTQPVNLDILTLTAARDALRGLLLDKHAGVGVWRRVATAKVDHINGLLEQLRKQSA